MKIVSRNVKLWCVGVMILSTTVNILFAQKMDRKNSPFPPFGQAVGGVNTQTPGENLGDLDVTSLTGAVPTEGVPLESTIDPMNYFVGPSDVITVNIWSSPPLSFTLTVTPEGTLIVPTVGEIRVADMTLAEAKDVVKKMIGTKYRGGVEPTVTLVRPRPLVVTVIGNVLNPGSFVLAAYYRADKAIEKANTIGVPQTPKDLETTLMTMSTRNITIRHKDGSMSSVDMIKFNATKEDRWNPYLREGDVIVVPKIIGSVIGVYGEVNAPGRYEYVRGDSIKDLLAIAQGFTSLAITDSIEFSRLSLDGNTMTTSYFDGEKLLAGKIPDTGLETGDRVVVLAHPELRMDYRVVIQGEVRYPGTYAITRNKTHLSEVIKRAGGFTEYASIRSSELIRQSINPNIIQLERLESARGGVAPEDSAYYYLETELRIQKENVTTNFEKLFIDGDSTQDVVLRDGDIIRVPLRQSTIYVFGQVVDPGHVQYIPGADLEYYIGQAGGYTERAREGDTKIVKARTRQWLAPDETSIEEGDYIWVPVEIEHTFAYYLTIAGQTAAIIAVAISVILLAGR